MYKLKSWEEIEADFVLMGSMSCMVFELSYT